MIFDTYRKRRTVRKANQTTRRIYRNWVGKNVTVRVGSNTVISDKLLGYDVNGDRLTLNFAGNVTVTNFAGGQPPTHIWCEDVRRAA